MKAKVTLLPGDGIGPEIVQATRQVFDAVAAKFDHQFEYSEQLIGGIAIDETGNPLPEETLGACLESDAILLGAVGGPKWDDPAATVRPEQGLLRIRKELGAFANIRPVKVFDALAAASPLQPERVKGVDIVFVRELTGGIYFGTPRGREVRDDVRVGFDTMIYGADEVERIVRMAFDLARQRRGKVTSVDKANVLDTSRLWRAVAHEVAAEYPDVEYEDLLVDAMAMYLINRPADFDVVVTGNMFGDILSDEASMITGSLGMLPSASVGGRVGLFEPIHGSAPDIAGSGKANPLATILSGAMMLRLGLELHQEAEVIEHAVDRVLAAGHRTADIGGGAASLNTNAMTELVIAAL
ncbi:MAG: 3-isopropylmalate dehydrogenase [Ardenticatenaceae bacterium]|nr:3-isopropylmalate dehydrogenase [Ardenticatenaceae bacterium]